jgi:hypothetical protein
MVLEIKGAPSKRSRNVDERHLPPRPWDVARDLRKSNYFFALFWFPQPQVAWRRCDLDGRSTERPGLLCGTTHAAALNDGKSTDQFLLRMTNYGEPTMQLALAQTHLYADRCEFTGCCTCGRYERDSHLRNPRWPPHAPRGRASYGRGRWQSGVLVPITGKYLRIVKLCMGRIHGNGCCVTPIHQR